MPDELLVGGRPPLVLLGYRVGQTRGHYEQGTPTPTAIDTGTVFITNKRVIFQGARQTRECLFAKLIGFEHSDSEGSTTFSVSNRQKPTTIRETGISEWRVFRHFESWNDLVIAAGLVPDDLFAL